jgi:hypothetical protein
MIDIRFRANYLFFHSTKVRHAGSTSAWGLNEYLRPEQIDPGYQPQPGGP